MRYILNIAAAAALALLTSCEVYLPDPGEEQRDEVRIAVSALVVAGDSVKLRLAHTESISEPSVEVYRDRSMLLRALMFPDTAQYPEDRYIMEKYYDELILRMGKVELTTGAGERIPMTFNRTNFEFECGHKAVPGERLEFEAQVQSRDGKDLKVSSNTVVPGWKPEAEIIEVTQRYKEREHRDDLDMDEMTIDSVYEVKIHIKDASADLHCYRLRVRVLNYNFEGDIVSGWSSAWDQRFDVVEWTDAYYTSDPLLYDSGITDMFGPWQAYTTDVFTNKNFTNGEYVLTVQARAPYYVRGNRMFLEVQLQPITYDLMNYLSTLYRVRVSSNDYFSEPMTISSNIKGGVGIFGSIGDILILRHHLRGDTSNYPEK